MNDLMTKSFLSYVDLKKQAQKDICEDIDVEAGQFNSREDHNLSEFFMEVASIKVEMEEIPNLLSDIKNLSQEIKSTHSTKIIRGLRDRIDSDMVSVLRKAKNVKSRLESLEKANASNREASKAFREGSPVDRTRVSITNGLRVKLRELVNDFQSLREKVLLDYKQDLKRRYYALTGEDPSEEVVEKMMSGSVNGLLLMREFDTKSKEKHQAILDLQRSLTKLHQVFLDMAVMVETQGEKIDDIQENVANAGGFISGGTNSLYYANQMKKKRKWLYWVCAGVLIILLVCVISTLVSS